MTAVAQKQLGDVVLQVDNISLSFGGVKAITDVSFNIHEHEVLAIIGPNGAGKTSMLNVINGFYHPQEGTITYKGAVRRRMRPHEAAKTGIARTGTPEYNELFLVYDRHDAQGLLSGDTHDLEHVSQPSDASPKADDFRLRLTLT